MQLVLLTALGVEANAYTTNDHTAYLFECTENFYPALDELMDYVQHPYFTDENVEKEKGIIIQEIKKFIKVLITIDKGNISLGKYTFLIIPASFRTH